MLLPCRHYNQFAPRINGCRVQRFNNSLGNVVTTDEMKNHLRELNHHAASRGFYNLAATHADHTDSIEPLKSRAYNESELLLAGLYGRYKPKTKQDGVCPLLSAIYSIANEYELSGSSIMQAWRKSLAYEVFSRYSRELKTGIDTMPPVLSVKIDSIFRLDITVPKNDEKIIAEVERMVLYYATQLKALGFDDRVNKGLVVNASANNPAPCA